MPDILRFHHLSLSVTDLARSIEWYRDTLGFEVIAELEGDGFQRARLRSGGGITLTLTGHDRNRGGGAFDERTTGMDHVAFDVGTPDAVEELRRRFDDLGVTNSGVKQMGPGTVAVTFRDPDGIQLEVFGTATA